MNHIYHLIFNSNRLRISFALLLSFYLSIWLFWLIFYLFFSDIKAGLDWSVWQQIIYLQHKFNLRLAAFVISPLLFITLLPKKLITLSRFVSFAHIYFFFACLFVCIFYIFNWAHYVYLARPIDASALRFLADGAIAASFVWQSYPVISLIISWLIISTLIWFLSFLLVKKWRIPIVIFRQKIKVWKKLLVFLLISLLFIGAIFGRMTQYPLRWSEAFFSSDEQVAYLSLNHLLYFVDTFKNADQSYDLNLVKKYYPLITDYLAIPKENQDNNNLTFSRKQLPKQIDGQKYNVVLIMLESLGANRLGIFDNPLNPTPNLDAIAQKGYFFSNFFVPQVGTARSVYSSIFGIPDVNKSKTATRNPLIIKQSSIFNEFNNYQKHYILGGSASWANIRGMLNANIADLQLFEGTYDSDYSKIDVWGISDTDLFKQANQIFINEAKNKQNFIAYVQTAGNHRPFSIPDDNEGFVTKQISDAVLRQSGFDSLAQYNGVRFLDHNIGYFFSLFEKSAYYGNTIFLLFGDHNDRSYDAAHMRNLEDDTTLDDLHVPLIIYAPGIITEAKVFNQAANLVDVLPTAAYLANTPINNTTLGKNLLEQNIEHKSFVIRSSTIKPTIGLVENDTYFVSNTDGSDGKIYDLNATEFKEMADKPSNYQLLKDLAQAIYQTSIYLQYHNGR